MSLSKVRNILLFFLFHTIVDQNIHANHIVGGDIQLLNLNNDVYKIRVNLYFDNVNGGLESVDAQALVGIFKKSNNQLVESFQIPYRSARRLEYSRPDCRNNNYSITRHFYELEVFLPPGNYNDPGGYYMVYERCCRNNQIFNIVNPSSIGMVFYLEFPRLDLFRNNSSPELPTPISDLICANRPYKASFAAKDADGDSLVYSFTTPLRGNTSLNPPVPSLPVPIPGPYNTIVWSQAQFTASQPIPGNPGIQIDPKTGQVTITPTLSGVFLFTVKVEEYRNGQKIGEVRRDLQWAITGCPTSLPPVGILSSSIDGSPLQETDTVLLEDNRCLRLRVADPNSSDRLLAKVVSIDGQVPVTIIPSTAQPTEGPTDSVDFLFCLNNCDLAKGQVLHLRIAVEDNSCPLALADTLSVFIKSQPVPNEPPILLISSVEDTITLKAGSSFDLFFRLIDTDNDLITLDIDRNSNMLRRLIPSWQEITDTGLLNGIAQIVTDCELLSTRPYLLKILYGDNSCYPSHQRSDSLWIKVTEPDPEFLSFLLPNMISPNGDGLNDFYQFIGSPSGACDPLFVSITIHNRWGKKVFESNEPTFRWSASEVPSGVYFATLQFQKKTFTSSIQVIKK